MKGFGGNGDEDAGVDVGAGVDTFEYVVAGSSAEMSAGEDVGGTASRSLDKVSKATEEVAEEVALR